MRKKLLLCGLSVIFCFLQTFAQQTISGKVTDPAGQPVVGSTVAVKGSKIATQTDAQGSFTLSVPASVSALIISSVGFETQEVAITGRSNVEVSLKTSTSSLNEVVVVGYGTQKRKDVTGAVSSVSAATIAKVPVTTLDQALQGRAPGVQIINNDASPGGNISVLIRGIGSLASGGNNPL